MKLVFMVFALLMSISCTKKENQDSIVSDSIRANTEAKSQLDWHSSGLKPVDLFKKWQEEKVSGDQVCESLKNISAKELTLFEDEINQDKNLILISACKAELQLELEDYWKSVRPK